MRPALMRRPDALSWVPEDTGVLDGDINFSDESRLVSSSALPIKDGDRITQVTDAIAGYVFDEVATNGPTFKKTRALGGRGYASFNATTQNELRVAQATGYAARAAGELWFVVRFDTITPTQQIFFATADEATTSHALYFSWRGTTNQVSFFQNDSGVDATEMRTEDDPAPPHLQANGDNAAGPGNWYVLRIIGNDTSWSYDINDIDGTFVATTGSNNGDWLGDTTLRDNVTLGYLHRTSKSNWFGGGLARALIFSEPLTANSEASVRAYLNRYYGRFANVGIVGDSWSDMASSWTEQARLSCSTGPAANINWVNCAIGGQTMAQMRSVSWATHLQPIIANLDAVVWYGSVNDMNDDVVTAAETLFASFSATADEVIAAGKPLIVAEVGPWGGNTSNWTNARQIKHNRVNELIRNYCAAHAANVQFVPAFQRLQLEPGALEKIVYPTADANIGYNDRIAKSLELSGGLHNNSVGDLQTASLMIDAVSRALARSL